MHAMEPALRQKLIEALGDRLSKFYRTNDLSFDFDTTGGSNSQIKFTVNQHQDRWCSRVVLSGLIDPAGGGIYCDGRITVSTWVRGAWEASLGAKVETYDPLYADLLTTTLKRNIREAFRAGGRLIPAARAVFAEVVGILDDHATENMLQPVLERARGAEAILATAIDLVPGPKVTVAIAFALYLNRGRPSLVKLAHDMAHRKILDELGSRLKVPSRSRLSLADQATRRRDQIVREILGPGTSAWPMIDYMQAPEPSEEAYSMMYEALVKFADNGDCEPILLARMAEEAALNLEQRGIRLEADAEPEAQEDAGPLRKTGHNK